MSRRNDAVRHNYTSAEELVRQKQAAKAFELGVPLCPEQYASNDRELWAIWKRLSARLLEQRVLSYADGDALLSLCKAQKAGERETARTILRQTWSRRPRFPAPVKPGNTLRDFLASVAKERATFQERVRPSFTIALDTGGEYTWPDSDAAAVARRYALDVTQGSIIAGELVRRAAQRFLSDLEVGHERGLFFDPLAARHIVSFSELFCDLHLLPWQTFVLANVFAFKRASGARRFTEAWCSTAKKSGKTRLSSCVALWGLIADQEKYPDVFSAATKKEQSRLVWRDAKRCVQDNIELREHVQRWSGSLAVKDTDGSFTPLSSDEKSMDGLRPSTVIADEISFWDSRAQWDSLMKGIVSRVQPLIFAITTAGPTKLCFAFEKFDLAEKILRKIFVDDTTFVFIARIDPGDDPMDEKCWPKANPSIGTTLHIEHLQKTRDEVLQQPSGMTSFIQYHCNIFPEANLGRIGSIQAKAWDACAGLDLIGETDPRKAIDKFLALNKDLPVFLGLDVGLTSDQSALAMLWRKARFAEGAELVDKKVLVVQFFMPEVGLLEKAKRWNVPLDVWARAGYIELCPGDLQDPKVIRKYILEVVRMFKVQQLNFDRWNAEVMCAELNESGAVSCIATPQTEKELSAPSRELLQWIHNRELVHFGAPCLAWHSQNVIMTESEKTGGCKPAKLSALEKIDGVQASVNAIHGMLNAPKPLSWGVQCLDFSPAAIAAGGRQ